MTTCGHRAAQLGTAAPPPASHPYCTLVEGLVASPAANTAQHQVAKPAVLPPDFAAWGGDVAPRHLSWVCDSQAGALHPSQQSQA